MSAQILPAPSHYLPLRDREPNGHLIEMLRQLLADAETGHIQAVAIAVIDRDRFGQPMWEAAPGTRAELAATIGRLEYRYHKWWDES